MIKFLKYFFQSIIIYLFFLIARILGIKLSRKVFSLLFSTIGPLFKSKKVIYKNLEIFKSYIPNINEKKIIENMWRNYGMTFSEYVFLKQLRTNNKISVKGKEYLDEIIKDGKPVIFVSGHFANFELMSMEITKRNFQLAAIYRPLNNIFLNPSIEFLRKKYICSNQIKKGFKGVRQAIDFLKKDFSIALMIDQRVSEGEKVNFFGREALTTTLPAQLSMKFNLKIVPVFLERTKYNDFIIEFYRPVESKNFKNKIELTKKLNNILENMIINNPNQWIWTHNRWK